MIEKISETTYKRTTTPAPVEETVSLTKTVGELAYRLNQLAEFDKRAAASRKDIVDAIDLLTAEIADAKAAGVVEEVKEDISDIELKVHD